MIKDINRYLKLLLVQKQVEVIALGLNLKIFKLLKEKNHSFSSLSELLNSDPYNTKVLLDSLVLLDLLYKEGEFYKNTQVSQTYFIDGAKSYCGDVFLHRKDMTSYENKMIKTLVKEGTCNLDRANYPKIWADAARTFFRQEQEHLMAGTISNIVKNLKEFKDMKKMLEIGCSSGAVGLEIIKNHPSLMAILYDFDEVTKVTDKHIKEYGLENRALTLSGDIRTDDIGSGYDLIWCSDIFYFFDDKEKIAKKIYDALNPNGIFLSAHVEIDENNKQDLESFFYLMFLNMQEKDILKPMELNNIYTKSGFKNISSFTNYDLPIAPVQVIIAKK